MTCNCTGRCRKPPYTCSGLEEPDFLTAKQRRDHERRFLAGETNWATPFEPWAVRTWARYMDENNLFEIADRVRANVLAATRIANDPSLTPKQKIAAIEELNKNPPPLDSHT